MDILALTAIALGEVSQWAIALLLRLNLTGGTGQKKEQIRNGYDFEESLRLSIDKSKAFVYHGENKQSKEIINA